MYTGEQESTLPRVFLCIICPIQSYTGLPKTIGFSSFSFKIILPDWLENNSVLMFDEDIWMCRGHLYKTEAGA